MTKKKISQKLLILSWLFTQFFRFTQFFNLSFLRLTSIDAESNILRTMSIK